MSHDVLLADAGHTRIKFAHCRSVPEAPLPEVLATVASIDDAPIDWNAITGWFEHASPRICLVTGTDLTRAGIVAQTWPKHLPAPTLLTDKSLIPIEVDVDFPEKVGIDRLLNAVAANALRGEDQPAIVVDTGTAITVDVVSSTGSFSGGAILPGIRLGAQSLHAYTTTLPLIDVWPLLETVPDLIGRNTEAAISSGLYWGHLGAVKELISRSAEALDGTSEPPLLLITGGAAVILAPYLGTARHEPSLSLQGLALTALQMAGGN
jgi:type III pantothenate kinase